MVAKRYQNRMRKGFALLVIGAFFLSPSLLFARRTKKADAAEEALSLEPGTYTPLETKTLPAKKTPALLQKEDQDEISFLPKSSFKITQDLEDADAPRKSIFDEFDEPKKPALPINKEKKSEVDLSELDEDRAKKDTSRVVLSAAKSDKETPQDEAVSSLRTKQKEELELFLKAGEPKGVAVEQNPSVMVDAVKPESIKPELDLTQTAKSNSSHEVQSKGGSPLVISSAWKQMMRQDLADKTHYISTIVAQGEDDDKEKNDFAQRFAANERWFDNTISKTEAVTDPYFDALMQRRDRLDTLVRAQRQADTLIQKMSMIKDMSPAVAKKLRLAALYGLNDMISSSGRMPTEKQISTIVESKAVAYGEMKDKDYSDPIPMNILNAELTAEVQRLKNVIAEQAEGHKKYYAELKKDLENKTQAQLQAHADYERASAELKEAQRAVKEALLRGDIEEQARRQAEFNAKKSIEKSTRRSLELEVSLSQAEKDKLAAERQMHDASAKYKEVSELVDDLKKQANDLNTRNEDLTLTLERVQQEKTTLELEREHAQRQYERLAQQQKDLSKQLSERNAKLTNLEIMLDHAQHEKSFALNQVSILEKIRSSHLDTEKTLRSYIGQLNNQLETAQQRTTELESVAQKLRDEQFSAQVQIKELERLRAESVGHEDVLKQAIQGLIRDRTIQEERRKELTSLLEDISNSNSRRMQRQAMQIRQQVATLQSEQEKTDANITMLRDMQSSEQLQQQSIDSVLGGLRTQISGQERQLAELQQSIAQQRIKQAVKGVEERVEADAQASQPLTEQEERMDALKRKNRDLKARLASLEESLAQVKQQIQKPAKSPEESMRAVNPVKSQPVVRPDQKTEPAAQAPVEPEKAEISTAPKPVAESQQKSSKFVIPTKPQNAEQETEVASEEKPAEESSTEPQSSTQENEASTDQEPAEQNSEKQSQEVAPEKPAPEVASALPAKEKTKQREEQKGPKKVARPEEQPKFVDQKMQNALQEGIAQHPEEFKEFVQNFQPSQEQIEQAQNEIAAMSPDERKEFEEFMRGLVGSLEQPKK